MAAPVVKDQELELTIDSLAYGGNGVARLNGFVVFVRRGLPGDTVRARVTKVQRRHAEALATEIARAGAAARRRAVRALPGVRRLPLPGSRVRGAGRGEGRRRCADALAASAGIADPPLEPILPADDVFHYRNKLEYSFTQLDDGAALGFHRAGRWDEVLEIEQLLADDRPRQRDPQRGARLGARASGSRRTTRRHSTGYLRHLVVREGRNTGPGARAARDGAGESASSASGFVDVLRAFPEVRSIHWSVNDTPAEVTNLPTQLLWGEDAIEEELCGLRFRVRPNAFLQTNTAMAERLYGLAREYAGLTGGETVYDLYCGIGTIGLALARDALTVWGVEVSEESVACALENAELNGIGNAAFFAGNVGPVARGAARARGRSGRRRRRPAARRASPARR